MTDTDAAPLAAAAVIAERTGVPRHDVAVVLGSGWAQASDVLPVRAEIPYDELPGFIPSRVPGHAGVLRSSSCAAGEVLVFSGRTHLYDGHGVDAAVRNVRTAAAVGCRVVLLTNGSGAVTPGFRTGDVAVLADHINLTGHSPLSGPRFVDMTDAYSPELRRLAHAVDAHLRDAVYAQFRGPQYETPAEVRMAAAMGADLVGMSTGLETIAARAEGLDVLALSLVTNPAAGVSSQPVNHDDILRVGMTESARLGALLAGILEEM